MSDDVLERFEWLQESLYGDILEYPITFQHDVKAVFDDVRARLESVESLQAEVERLRNPWVRVEDELPEPWERVDFVSGAIDDPFQWFGCLDDYGKWRADESYADNCNIYPESDGYGAVTHFMRRPPLTNSYKSTSQQDQEEA